jgi:hypothetical protein
MLEPVGARARRGRFRHETSAVPGAVEAIGRIHDIMRQIACRAIPSGELRDVDATVRRRIPEDDLGRLRPAGVRRAAPGRRPDTPSCQGVMATLPDIGGVAPEQRRPAVQRQRALLCTGVESAYDADADVRATSTADAQGIGSGAGVVRQAAGPPLGGAPGPPFRCRQ